MRQLAWFLCWGKGMEKRFLQRMGGKEGNEEKGRAEEGREERKVGQDIQRRKTTPLKNPWKGE